MCIVIIMVKLIIIILMNYFGLCEMIWLLGVFCRWWCSNVKYIVYVKWVIKKYVKLVIKLLVKGKVRLIFLVRLKSNVVNIMYCGMVLSFV